MSQEYTPVDWVDETTSQQGTLINAERLNQMQTAHHYADGFEEVDAIPTEDPGVDYHKVVYCTADATFYRWDGEVWTADIDEETKHLLDQEIARATQAEGVLRADITAEATARANADTALGQRIDGLGADTLPMTHGTSTPTIQNAVAANAGNIDNLSNEVEGLEASKADKATTLAGYGITDAYTKAQADTLLAGKVDKLVSSPAGTYKSVTVNAQGQVTAGTNPDTLAGYGITDAYNKTEADTLLAAKADTTALTDGSVTKVGTADLGTDTKPIKLVAGVPTAVTNDLVSTIGDQDIAGAKTFGTSPTIKGVRVIIDNASNKYVDFRDGSGTSTAVIQATPGGVLNLAPGLASGGTKAVTIQGQRAYNAANTSDVATIATLDGYSPMVRTTNAQTIGGIKTFTDYIKVERTTSNMVLLKRTDISRASTFTTYNDIAKINILDNTDNMLASIDYYTDTGNKRVLQFRVASAAANNDGYFQLITDGDGNRSINTNFPKPLIW